LRILILSSVILGYLYISYLHIFKNADHMNIMYLVRKMFHRIEGDFK
jgi:hypothetical protein